MRAAWCIVALIAGCGDDNDPKFSAVCSPATTNDGVTCTIQNLGKKPGRACLTVRLSLERRMPIVSRRACTAVLDPQQTATVSPPFMEQLAPCVKTGRWTCPIDVLETSRSLGENLPSTR